MQFGHCPHPHGGHRERGEEQTSNQQQPDKGSSVVMGQGGGLGGGAWI